MLHLWRLCLLLLVVTNLLVSMHISIYYLCFLLSLLFVRLFLVSHFLRYTICNSLGCIKTCRRELSFLQNSLSFLDFHIQHLKVNMLLKRSMCRIGVKMARNHICNGVVILQEFISSNIRGMYKPSIFGKRAHEKEHDAHLLPLHT